MLILVAQIQYVISQNPFSKGKKVVRVSFWCYTTNNPQKTNSHNFRVTFYHFWMRKATVSHFQTQFRKNQTRFLFPRSPDFGRIKAVGVIFFTSPEPETV